MSLDELIKAANQLDETDLDRLFRQVVAQRLEALANLAQLRQVSLTQLMETLGIQPVTYV